MAYVPYCAYCVVVVVVVVCVCVWRALWEGGEGIVLNFMLSTHSPGHTLHGVDSSQHDTRRVVLRSVRVVHWFCLCSTTVLVVGKKQNMDPNAHAI